MEAPRGRRTVLITAAAAAAVVVASGIAGKDLILERWWIWRLGSEDAATFRAAAERLWAMRSRRAIPALVESLGAGRVESEFVVKTLLRIGSPAVAEVLAVHGRPFLEFLYNPSLASKAASLLRDCIDDRRLEVRLWAVYGLSTLVEPSDTSDPLPPSRMIRPILLEGLRSESPRLRRIAVECLGIAAGRGRRFAVPALAEALEDPEPEVREAAGEALAEFPDLRAIPVLGKALGDRELEFRSKAWEALVASWEQGSPAEWEAAAPDLIGAIEALDLNELGSTPVDLLGAAGPAARRAVPALVKLIEGGNHEATLAALRAIRRIGAGAAAAVPAVLGRIGDPVVGGTVIEILVDLGPVAVEAVPALVGILRDGKPVSPEEILRILGSIGPGAVEALPAIRTVLGDPSAEPLAHIRAAVALGRIAPGDPRSLAALRAVEVDLEEWSFVEDLAGLGPLARSQPGAIPILARILDGDEAFLRFGAARALGEAGPAARSSLPGIERCLDEAGSDLLLRLVAARAIWRISGDASKVLPVLADVLDGSLIASISEVAGLLAEMGPAAAPALVEKLAEPGLCEATADALARIGPAAAPALAKALGSDRDWTRYGAARALAALGPEARAALPALEAIPDDDDEDVRALAARAVAAIRGSPR